MGFRKSLLLIGTILGAGIGAQAGAQSAAPFTTAYTYDAERRLVGVIEPDPDGSGTLHYMATRNTYDAAGRLTKVEKGELATWQPESVQPVPLNWTGFTVYQEIDTTYDALDRKIVESERQNATSPINTVTQTSYDLAGRVDCVTERMNPTVWTALPASACTLQTTGSNGPDRITHNGYDAAGQLLKVQKAYQITTANGFPATLQQDYATYEYKNLNGKQTSVTDADGNYAALAYDGQDREVQWTFPSPTTKGSVNAADYEAYGYDPNGNRTSLRKRDNTTITYQYDALNHVTVKTVPISATGVAGYTVYQGYDNRGLLLYARFGSATGAGITNTYDSVGRLASSSTNMDGTSRTFTSTYDADGNRAQLSGDAGYVAKFDYDGLDRMSVARDSAGTSLATFTYDPIGRRSLLGQGYGASTSTTAYAYDGASRLQTMTHDLAGTLNDQVLGFGYNPASQIVQRTRSNSGWEYTEQTLGTKSYAINGLNQYTSAAGVTFAYDANGNLSSDGTSTYKYDAENRLVSVGLPGQQPSVTLSYDPMGRLWQYTGPQSGMLRFLYDGDQLTEEENTSGGLLRDYLHGAGEDEPLVWYESAGTPLRHFLHADQQGSIVAVTDDTGNALAIDKYDEWGVPASGNSPVGSPPLRFQYTGQMWLPDLEVYYYKARIYSSRLGRFLQTDPIGYKDQVNLYAYVGNDPVDGRDATGLYGCTGSRICGSFNNDQAAAIRTLSGSLNTLRNLAHDLAGNKKLSSSERQAQANMDKYLGHHAGHNVQSINALIGAGTQIMNVLESKLPITTHSQVSNWYASTNVALPTYLYPKYFTSSPTMRMETLIHEGSHKGLGTHDWGVIGSVRAARFAITNPTETMQSADNVALSLGFKRDD